MTTKASHVYQQSGFTLIELIMVIVILGILSAFALPKFADFSSDAEQSSIEGARGAVKSASAISHAQYLAAGNNPSSIIIEGTTIDMINGYPSADTTEGDICEVAGLDSSDYTCTTDNTTTPPSVTISLQSNTSCAFTYSEATATASPIIGTVSGC